MQLSRAVPRPRAVAARCAALSPRSPAARTYRHADRDCHARTVGWPQPTLAAHVDRRRLAVKDTDANERARAWARNGARGAGTFGRTHTGSGLQQTMPETLHYSVVAAIQTLWLAARADGIGMGWVSILDPVAVTKALDVPKSWSLVAYLCLGLPRRRAPRSRTRAPTGNSARTSRTSCSHAEA